MLLFIFYFLTSPFLDRPGQYDFREYWSAYRLLSLGIDSYSPSIMLKFQREHFDMNAPLMMWNPPWLLIFMYPVLALDFEFASEIWIFVQIVLYLFSFHLLMEIYQKTGSDLPHYLFLFLCSLCFPPVLQSIYIGQIGVFLLFGSVLSLFGLVRGSMIYFIPGVLIMSTKPHLFLLFGGVLLWYLIKRKLWIWISLSVFSLFILFLMSELLFPGSMLFWINSFSSSRSSDLVPSVYQWLGSNFGSALRGYVSSDLSYVNFILPPVLVLLSVSCLVLKSPRINWAFLGPPLFAVSVFFSPFGWFFDQAVLFSLYFFILSSIFSYQKWFFAGVLLGLQLFTCLFVRFWATTHLEVFWYAPVMIILWYLACYRPMVGNSMRNQ
ncbi:MAG TPA: glycosyltransferase family 87 protein [Oligoflexia bacterium]|nr:glycosyltransferase family 87 protein [Oligoflexia bacterium]